MSSVLTHKGYHGTVEFDADDGLFVGRVAGIRDGVGFHADNVADLRAAFEEAVDDYLATCARLGREPQKPYSGKLMFRVDPSVHAGVALAAQIAGLSLNAWAEATLRDAAQRETERA